MKKEIDEISKKKLKEETLKPFANIKDEKYRLRLMEIQIAQNKAVIFELKKEIAHWRDWLKKQDTKKGA